jgi:hypothetical protein
MRQKALSFITSIFLSKQLILQIGSCTTFKQVIFHSCHHSLFLIGYIEEIRWSEFEFPAVLLFAVDKSR